MSSKTVGFSLPFNGEWLTFWGGDTAEQNHHHSVQSQRYAFDFIVVAADGRFVKTDGKTNNDYYSFGLDVLAPADGEVVEAVDGLRDNAPKETNNFNFCGNYIMIKHDEKTYSILGHLQQGSVAVKRGEKVKKGQTVALCGNSGNTTDPHLHFHVQDSDIFARVDESFSWHDVAKGVKVYFSHIRVNGEIQTNHSPVKGERVSN